MNTSAGIDLDQYRTQAKDLLKLLHAADPAALDRVRQHHPEGPTLLAAANILLADAQLVIARENGFGSWAKFKEYILFRSAVDALDSGDTANLKTLLSQHAFLTQYRCRRGEWYETGYFAGATLLHHVAGNPIRRPLPANIVDVARIVLDAGADPNALCGDPPKNTTIGLIITGRQVSEAGVSTALIDLLTAAGASPADLANPDVLTLPLWNGGLATARSLAARGARVALRHAAGLGDAALVRQRLTEEGSREAVEQALLYAAVQGHVDIARLLLAAGATGDTLTGTDGITPRSALHEAANRGHRRFVELLLSSGADRTVVEPRWEGTPAGWAHHGGHEDIAALLA